MEVAGASTIFIIYFAIILIASIYAIWLLVFPILIYSRIKEILIELKSITYIAKFISYKEIYYCPKCLVLSREEGKCSKCGNALILKKSQE